MPPSTLVAPVTVGNSVRPSLPGGATPAPGLARLPIVLIGILFGYLLLPRVAQDPHLVWCFAGVASFLLAWYAALWMRARHRGRTLPCEYVAPIRQHYIQASMQGSVYAYWGWYWAPIYSQVPLILSQLVFAFAFDALLSWSRGRAWRMTSGPFPIVLSTNLFIWFVDTWFALQFAMIAVALLGKEFLKWQKEGRRTHIFNPSGFALLVAAVALIATGTTDALTMARPLATTIDSPPHIYLVIFAVGLVVQRFFAVTLMTLSAAVVTVLAVFVYHEITAVHLFPSSNLPAAGFLGMHLLMTDPSTSPRTNLGRALFGAGYGIGYVTMFIALGPLGDLELYAKLFPVPVLNCTVIALDRFARTGLAGRINRRWESTMPAGRMNLVHMGLWIVMFASLWIGGYFRQPHPGASVAFWKHAVAEGKPQASRKLAMIACGNGSGDALNEVGILSTDPAFMRIKGAGERPSPQYWFASAASDSLHACRNLVAYHLFVENSPLGPALGLAFQRVVQDAEASPGGTSSLLLAYAHETGRGAAKDIGKAVQLYRASESTLAHKGIVRIALSQGGEFVDVATSVAGLQKAADAGDAEAAWYLAHVFALGRGVPVDAGKARELLQRACDRGMPRACSALQQDRMPAFVAPTFTELERPTWSTAFPE